VGEFTDSWDIIFLGVFYEGLNKLGNLGEWNSGAMKKTKVKIFIA